MSARRSRSMSALFEHAFIIVMLFMVPLIASFLIYLVASAFGATGAGLPTVGYGIGCASTAGGVCTLWVLPTTVSGTSPTLPIYLLNLLNALLIFISLVLGVVAAVKLGPTLFEAATGGNE